MNRQFLLIDSALCFSRDSYTSYQFHKKGICILGSCSPCKPIKEVKFSLQVPSIHFRSMNFSSREQVLTWKRNIYFVMRAEGTDIDVSKEECFGCFACKFFSALPPCLLRWGRETSQELALHFFFHIFVCSSAIQNHVDFCPSGESVYLRDGKSIVRSAGGFRYSSASGKY